MDAPQSGRRAPRRQKCGFGAQMQYIVSETPHSRAPRFRTIRGASGNTKYGIIETPRRTENHDGLGLALADPRHPTQLTVQTKTKRHESTHEGRLRSPPVCQPNRRSGRSCCCPSRYWASTARLNVKYSESIEIFGILRSFEIDRKIAVRVAPLQDSCLWSKWRGGVRYGGGTCAG